MFQHLITRSKYTVTKLVKRNFSTTRSFKADPVTTTTLLAAAPVSALPQGLRIAFVTVIGLFALIYQVYAIPNVPTIPEFDMYGIDGFHFLAQSLISAVNMNVYLKEILSTLDRPGLQEVLLNIETVIFFLEQISAGEEAILNIVEQSNPHLAGLFRMQFALIENIADSLLETYRMTEGYLGIPIADSKLPESVIEN